jgi:hypothetical protein
VATTWTQSGSRSGQASQATTESAPSGSTLGVDLDSVGSVCVVLHAPVGQTFDGTGTLLGYRFLANAWVRAPRADVDMADYAGLSDVAPPSLLTEAPVGRFIYMPSGIGLSGGSTITTDYVCTLRLGSQGPA